MKKHAALEELVTNLTTTDFLLSNNERCENAVVECKKFLNIMGYKVIDPIENQYKMLKSIDDIIEYFYEKYEYTFPNLIVSRNQLSKDRSLAKRFVETIAEENKLLDKGDAVTYCGAIIDAIFKNIDKFHFETPINFGIFGQENMKWVMNAAIRFINTEEFTKKKRQHKQYHDKYDEEMDTVSRPFADLDEIYESLKED